MYKSPKKFALAGFILLIVALLSLLPLFGAFAARTGNQGQPNQSCQSQPMTPGSSASAPGSAFNTSGKSQTVYAGQQPQNSNNPNSVAQYDVACFQVSQH